jgi:AAA ATPase domain
VARVHERDRAHPLFRTDGSSRWTARIERDVDRFEPRPQERGVPFELIGREREVTLVEHLVESGRRSGGAIAVRGDVGTGKSCLLAVGEHVARTLGTQVLTVTGAPAEADLGYVGLHSLLRPVMSGADRLTAAQRGALSAAFGPAGAAGADPFMVAQATLELLADAALRCPVLLLVDDAQWLDGASVDVLAFVARRLASERIALIVALTEGWVRDRALDGLRELHLVGLDDTAAARLSTGALRRSRRSCAPT